MHGRGVCLPLLIAAQFAWTLPSQQLPSPRRTLGEPTARILRERMGGEPFAVMAAWLRAGRDQEPPAWLPEQGNPRDAAFHELLHAALWCEDKDAAYAAASLLPEDQLDIADIDRWLQVVQPHVFAEEPRWEWDTLKHVMSSDDIARLLENPQCWFAEIRYFFLDDLHRSMRPEHIPALAKLTHHDDPFVRKGAWGNLCGLSGYTNRHRDVIARTLLEWPGPAFAEVVDQDDRSRNPRHVPRSYTLPATRPGWSPLLRAALERSFLELAENKDGVPFSTFLLRWAEDEQPADEDRLLLAALLGSPHPEGIGLALRTICRLAPDAHLQRLLQQPPESAPKALVLAARRDWHELHKLAATDAEALAVALEFDFDGAWLPWVTTAFGKDVTEGLAAIERLVEASGPLQAPYRSSPKVPGQLRQAIELFGDQMDHARLHQLVIEFPAARSERLMKLYAATVTPANLAESAVAALEVSTAVDFQGMLAGWAKSTDPAQSRPALDLLLKLGDATHAEQLLQHWQAHDGKDLFLLARCGRATVVQEFLAERLRSAVWTANAELGAEHFDALGAVGVLHGLPEAVARHWADHLAKAEGDRAATHRAQFPAYRERVLDHDPIDALITSLAGVPAADLYLPDLGTVDDDRVRDLLRKVRNSAGCNVQWAIGELALAGDFASKREMDEMRIRHLYGWFDAASANARTLGKSLDLVPYLLGEIETICCRRNGAAWALQELTGFDAWAQPERGLVTQHDYTANWWRAVGTQLRWSKIAQRFVVAGY